MRKRAKRAKTANEMEAGPFERFAEQTARLCGRPVAFLAASTFIVAWALSGPVFHFSDTWQLVVNTSTTIITFLMVFLIQHTQNRDTLALQIKLAELIIRMKGADNALAVAEGCSLGHLEALHDELLKLAAPATLVKANGKGNGGKRGVALPE